MLVTAEQKKFLVLVMDLAYQKRERGKGRERASPGFQCFRNCKLNRAAFMLCDISKPLALSTWCQISNLEIFIVTGISFRSLSSQKNCHQTVLANLLLLSDFFSVLQSQMNSCFPVAHSGCYRKASGILTRFMCWVIFGLLYFCRFFFFSI